MKPFINKKTLQMSKSLSRCIKNSKSKILPSIKNRNTKENDFHHIY